MGRETHIGQTVNKLDGKSLLTCLLHEPFFRRGVCTLPLRTDEPELDVGVYGVVEQAWLLLHQAYLRPPPFEVNFSQGPPADRDEPVPPLQALTLEREQSQVSLVSG